MAACSVNRPGRPRVQRIEDETDPGRDRITIPQRAILLLQQQQATVRCRTRGCSCVGEQEQRKKPADLTLVGHEGLQHAREIERTLDQVATHEDGAGRCGVAGRVKQMNNGEHGVEPIRQFVLIGHAVGDPGGRDLFLGPRHPGRHRGLGHDERLRNLGGREAAHET